MAHWLSEHPRVFMSPVKEPHHYNTDMDYVLTPARDRYEKLFSGANGKHLAVGEASTWYMYSRAAVPAILADNPGARFIAMLRNPSDMAHSLYTHNVWGGDEPVGDFIAAWGLSEQRVAGMPRHAYQHACLLGDQMERLCSLAPPERVCVVLLDDVVRDTLAEYRRVLDFLGVEYDGRTDFPVKNAAKKRRLPALGRGLFRADRVLKAAKRKLGVEAEFGALRAVNRLNSRRASRERPGMEALGMMRRSFSGQVDKLEELLDRDLGHWRED